VAAAAAGNSSKPGADSIFAELGLGTGTGPTHPADLCGVALCALQALLARAQRQQRELRRLSADIARCRTDADRAARGKDPGEAGEQRP
jgi:hypothetical protein